MIPNELYYLSLARRKPDLTSEEIATDLGQVLQEQTPDFLRKKKGKAEPGKQQEPSSPEQSLQRSVRSLTQGVRLIIQYPTRK